jgi:hypothetical protein
VKPSLRCQSAAWIVALGLLACGPGGQEASGWKPVRLDRAQSWPGSFSSINGIAELSPDRLIVVDSRERMVWLVDRMTGAVSPVSRSGPGWNEYTSPSRVFRCGLGATVYDAGGRKLLMLDSLGTVVRVKSFADRLWATVPLASDAACRLYFEGQLAVRPGVDSAEVFRWNPSSGESTSVFRIRATKRASYEVSQRSGTNVSHMQLLLPQPFSDGDEWNVIGDSTPVLASNGPGSVDLRIAVPGRVAKTWSLPVAGIEVSDVDQRGASPAGTTVNWSFPKLKPPIVDGSALGSSGGPMVIGMHTTAGDSTRYLIVELDGNEPGLLVLSPGSRVVGIGARTVYLAAEDSVGLLSLSGSRFER